MTTRNDDRRRWRRPEKRTGEGGRQLQSAGAAIVVCLGALVIALFLNAPGLHKSATIQPKGWKRDVALAVTGPLQTVSHTLLLDRPRKGLKDALGRSQDDIVDTVVAGPGDEQSTDAEPAAPKTGAQPSTPPKRKRFTPGKPLRLWIAGDSLAIVPGQSILRAVAGNRSVKPLGEVEGRLSTGLERPDVYNWFSRTRDVMQKEKPDAVVVMFGGNDDHGYMTGLPEGLSVSTFGSQAWREEYRRRVATIMNTATRNGAFIVWIGLPITKDADQTRRFDTINAIVQAEAARRPGRASYLDTYFFFAGKDGGYAQYVENGAGRLVKMRADDGVHFERPAGDLIADKVLERITELVDLGAAKKRATASAAP
jgi:hypothetical protein